MTQMHRLTIAPLERLLTNLKNILQKAQVHVKAHEYDDERLTQFRLYPDMLPLRSQVYIATDVSKFAAARLSGNEAPSFEDVEVTFEALMARVDKTLAFLKSVKPEAVDGSEEKEITIKNRRGEIKMSGLDYAQNYVMPNAYFHVTTTYAILRHNGVELGKMDFLGGV